METLLQVLDAIPVSPRLVNPNISRELETITLKCLEKDPARRYASAQALAEDLGRWLEGKPILARPPGPIGRLVKWVRRRPAIATLFALIAAMVVASWLGMAAFVHQCAQTVVAKDQATKAAHEEQVARRRAERNHYFSQVARAQMEWQRNDLEQARAALTAVEPEQRNWEWHYLNQIAKPPRSIPLLRTVAYRPFHDDDIAGVLWIPRERGLPNEKGTGYVISIVDRTTGVIRRTICGDVANPAWQYFRLVFSPDGDVLLTARSDHTTDRPALIEMWNADSGEKRFELDRSGVPDDVRAVSFHPNGTLFATAHLTHEHNISNRRYTVKIWDTTNGTLQRTLESFWTSVLQFHPRKSWIADGQHIWDLESGTIVRDLSSLAGGAASLLSFSPDGDLMAVQPSNAPTTIHLLEVESGNLRRSLSGHTQRISPSAVAFSPDGKWLASGTDENNRAGEVKLWDIATGTEIRSFRGSTSRIDAIALHPKRPEIAVVSNPQTYFFDPCEDREAISIPLPQQREFEDGFVWFTPDSRRVITANRNGGQQRPTAMLTPMLLTCRDATAGDTLWSLDTEQGSLAMAPNGSMLAFIEDDGVHVIDAATGGIVRVMPEIKAVKLEIPGGSTFNSSKSSMLAFDPSGRFLAGCMTTKELTTRSVVWDAESGQVMTPPDGWSINIGPHQSIGDANVLFKAGIQQGFGWGTCFYDFETDRVVRAEGREIVVRDASTLRVERRFGLFASNVDGLSLNADRTQIAGQAGDEIRVWNFATGVELSVPKGIEPFAGRAFGSNGERLVISGEQGFLQMKRQTSPTESLTAGSMVRFRYGNGRHFDRQMRWSVIKDAGGWPATLLDLESGKEKEIGAKNTHLMSCAFFPDGKRLATGDAEGSVRIWDTETWTAVLTLRAHERGITNLAVSADGRRMATVGWDAKLKIWDGTPDAIND